jgi:hypothetical protein
MSSAEVNLASSQFQDALTDSLIDFQEKQNPQNAIALCSACHTNIDHVYNPSFFFLPTDLNYFLNYERQDRKRHRNWVVVRAQFRRGCVLLHKYIKITKYIKELKVLG